MSSPLSAFTAVPNPQMLAFMGTQSFIMMYQAGEGWQYGKRKQSAMSNEEFNKQTPLSIMDRQRTELIKALPSIKDSMNAMTPLISTIVEQYGDFINEAIKATKPAIDNATKDLNLPFFAYGDTGKSTSQSQGTDFGPIIQALAKWITGGPVIKYVGGPQTTGYIETEAERKAADELAKQYKIKDEDVFKNADIDNPPTNIPTKTDAARRAQLKTQPTEGAIRRGKIADSGLSPVAYNARETFKANIDKTAKILQDSLDAQARAYPQHTLSQRDQYKSMARVIPIHTKKLSALRIKFFQVYGFHY